jgi:hypothetical protein
VNACLLWAANQLVRLQRILLRFARNWWLLLMWSSLTWPVLAHDARPVAVTITESLPGLFQASVRIPPTVAPGNLPTLTWPAACAPLPAETSDGLISCEGTLNGQFFMLSYPVFNPSLASYYRLDLLDGRSYSGILPPSVEVWAVPAAVSSRQVAGDYLLLGLEHIIGGLDHLLFVLGLLVIARTPRRILLAVTGFTLAHSITLSLASFGVLAIPIVPVEATIALSILFLAHEISRGQRDSITWRQPLLVSFGFGLLHGLGFASALGEIGLVQNEVLVSLLFFNLGVEAGQVLFIVVILLLVAVLQRLLPAATGWQQAGGTVLVRRGELAAAYLIGVPSAYWLIDRVAQFLL